MTAPTPVRRTRHPTSCRSLLDSLCRRLAQTRRSLQFQPPVLQTVQMQTVTHAQAHRHTHLTALFPGLPGSAGTRKVKPIWILLKQETASSSGLSWATCKSAPRSRQITKPAPYHSVFLQAGCPSCHTTNSVKALSRCIAGRNLNRNSFISSSRSAVQYTTIIINNATTTGMYGQRHLTS